MWNAARFRNSANGRNAKDGGNDVQSTLGQDFLAQFRVVALEAHDHGYFHADFLNRADNALCDQVAADNTAEDVDQYGFNIVV